MSRESIEINNQKLQKTIRIIKMMPNRIVFDENIEKINWPEFREKTKVKFEIPTVIKGIEYHKEELAGAKTVIAIPENTDHRNVILYIHGGGFISGSAFTSISYISMLARHSGYKVIAPDYPLSPEHKFPTAFETCCEVFDEVVKQHPNSRIALVGESAGANLCLSVALAKKELKKISAVIVHSPLIDLSYTLDHHMHEVNDFTVKEGGLEPMKRIYVGDADVRNPYISPMYGDFLGFPATFITCDHNETLYADADRLYEICWQNDVKVELVELKGTFHAFPASGLELPETDRILDRSIEFIRENLGIERK